MGSVQKQFNQETQHFYVKLDEKLYQTTNSKVILKPTHLKNTGLRQRKKIRDALDLKSKSIKLSYFNAK